MQESEEKVITTNGYRDIMHDFFEFDEFTMN